METIESIPDITEAYLYGQDIFYQQFNDLNFYVEDINQEQLYLTILATQFSKLKIEKIFPLNGKQMVIEEAQKNVGQKNKIFIVDKDFDDLLNRIIDLPNLFYLKKYCVENYLMEENALLEYIIEENPKLMKSDVRKKLALRKKIRSLIDELKFLAITFFFVQLNELPIKSSSHHVSVFLPVKFNNKICKKKLDTYLKQVDTNLKSKSINIDLKSELDNLLKGWEKSKILDDNICGKYLLFMLLVDIKKTFRLKSIPNHYSACYRIAKSCKFKSLKYLKNEIDNFLN